VPAPTAVRWPVCMSRSTARPNSLRSTLDALASTFADGVRRTDDQIATAVEGVVALLKKSKADALSIVRIRRYARPI